MAGVPVALATRVDGCARLGHSKVSWHDGSASHSSSWSSQGSLQPPRITATRRSDSNLFSGRSNSKYTGGQIPAKDEKDFSTLRGFSSKHLGADLGMECACRSHAPPSGPPPPRAVAKSVLCETEDADNSKIEEEMLAALKARKTDDAWRLHQLLRSGGVLASQVCLSRLVAQLSHQGTAHSLSRAQRVLVDLQNVEQVSLLDEDSLGLLVMASARTGAARYASSILRLMLRMGMWPSVKVWSAVVSRLGKHPYDAPLALELFDEICSYLKLDFSNSSRSEDGSDNGAGKMDVGKLEAGNVETALSNSNRTSVIGRKRVASQNEKLMDMRPDTAAFNAVLNACATVGRVKEADDMLERMAACGVRPDLLTFNILIKLFAKAQEGDQFLHILQEMEEAGIEPDLTTYNSLVSSYVNLGELDEAECLVKSMQQQGRPQQQQHPGPPTTTQRDSDSDLPDLIDVAAQSRDGEGNPGLTGVLKGVERSTTAARRGSRRDVAGAGGGEVVEQETQVKATREDGKQHRLKPLWVCKVKPNVRTYTTLMKGYVKNDRLKDAVELLLAMQHEDDTGSQPNEVTYTTVIAACIDVGLMDEAKSVLLEMAAQRVPANLVTYNILLKGYCNAGQVSTAYEVIEDMRAAGLAPDAVSYNTLINGCIRRDDNVGALEVFREMRRARVRPTEISYTTLMNAFARNGQPKLVAEVFQEMRTHEWMRVDVIAWNVLIDGHCKAGQMKEAKQAFMDMKEQGFHPSVATYGTLVKGYQAVGEPGEVLVLWKEIKERTEAKKGDGIELLEPDGGLLDYLVDTCLRAGYFQKAMEVVACMEGEGILADKIKYKRMFIELYSSLYTSKHASAKRRAKSADRRSAVDAFKFWLGLPNQYYQRDWTP